MDSNDLPKNPPSSVLETAGVATPDSALALPSAPEDGFRTKVGASIVEEFVAGHTASDVLRELVQNEFDAGGDRMSVVFGKSDLSIFGTGRPIDRKGWSRLDVVIGTGRVAGDIENGIIEAKQNGIGSKNFGLRSLFLFGNRIYVRSAGRMAVLDLPRLGTQIVPDPALKGRRGVQIRVPYRDAAFHKLTPFAPEREADAFDKMACGLLATLLKLALTGLKPGIRSLTLRSERNGRTLIWHQNVQPVPCRAAGIKALRRIGRLTDDKAADTASPTTAAFEELEFTRAVAIPAEFHGQPFPSYYRAGEHAVRVSVSLPIRRRRIDLSVTGRFYYPLQAPSSATGSALSVNAPFELVADRSALLGSDWNRWLAEQAADLAVTLLTQDWYQRFGPDAYSVLCWGGQAQPDTFANTLRERLAVTACWPTAGKARFAKAIDLVVPERRELNGLLGPDCYLAPTLSEIDLVAKVAKTCGAKAFTRNSLIRLRCADSDSSHLETKVGNDANYYFTDYDRDLREPERQIKMGRAIASIAKHLSSPNRQDLRSTASTLAADGTLRPAKYLFVVSEELWDVCPVPMAGRLHRALINESAIARLCEPFDLDTWIQSAARRAAAGTFDEKERQALYEHLLSEDPRLSRRALAEIRCSPVVRNQRDEWVTPNMMVMLPAEQRRLLNSAIHLPAARMAKNRKLIASLRIRNRLTGSDLVAFAEHLSEEPEKAEDFESLLKTHSNLLSHKIVAALEAVPFLRARSGVLAAPSNLHLDNPINRICAGNDDRIVAGRNVLLYKRLGCRERPSASTMLQVLSEARKQDRAPPHAEIFYPTLVLALNAERQAVDGHATDRILRIGDTYHAPQDVLVGPQVPSCFISTVPYLRGPSAIVNAFASLGAASHPSERHWVRFFSWSHGHYGPDDAVPSQARRLLMDAYQRRGHAGLPSDVGNTIRCLLGRDHRLYTRHDMRETRLVEDDFPALSAALVEQGASIQFADLSEASRNFFHALGLKRLTSIAPTPSLSVGTESQRPAWFQSQHAEQVLTLIRRDDFARALDLLAYAHQRESEGFRAISRDELSLKLSRIERIAFVARIDRIYTVGGRSAAIETEAAALPDRIALKPMRSKFELEQYLASALAELVGAVNLTDARRISLSILPLLRCQTSADMLIYLERQGMQPNSWIDLDVSAADPPAEADASISPEAEGLRQMVDQMFAKARTNTQDLLETASEMALPNSRTSTPSPPSPAFVIPSLDAVQATVLEPSDHVVAVRSPSYSTSSGSDRDGSWAPRDWNAIERDRKVGERGEEIVYRLELERVRQLGHAIPEQHVVWISKTDPGADHDIRSIDDDGKPIWIEVKSTTGTDGRFDWPQREFEKALREGKRYILWRVYEAHTEHPTAKPFRDPAGLFARSALRLEISGLRGFVEPKCT